MTDDDLMKLTASVEKLAKVVRKLQTKVHYMALLLPDREKIGLLNAMEADERGGSPE